MRALLYVRLSKEDAKGKVEGIESTGVQTADGKVVIAQLGWTLHSVQVDDDISGTLIDRPGLDAVRAAARNHEIDVVVVRCLDRLTRLEAARTMALLLELFDLGVRAYDYEKRRFMSLSGTDGLLTYVEAMQAEGEARKASERIRSALRARARDGRAVRMACFGYRINVACAVTSTSSLWCWGANADGTLGQGMVGASTPTPVHVQVPVPVASVTLGVDHVCALGTDHSVWCWGANDLGQLGNGSTAAQVPTPTRMTFH